MRSSLPQLPPPRRRPRRKMLEKRKETVSVQKFGAKIISIILITYLILSRLYHTICKNLQKRQPQRLKGSVSLVHQERVDGENHPINGKRIALFIPYIGANFPPYMDIFCQTAGGSASVMDIYIFHTNVPYTGIQPIPDNIKLINMESTEGLVKLLLRVLQKGQDGLQDAEQPSLEKFNEKQFVKIVTKWLAENPYALVEFKIASGHIFYEYLSNYSHWGYTDLDIVWGDLQSWITSDEWNDYDIVTYTFGDQNRAYLRGQFTFHKNEERLNQLWRGCSYLENIEDRFYNILKGNKHFQFESAEGCYSKVVLGQKDIRIKYAVKAWTDHIEPPFTQTHDENSFYTHGLYVYQNQTRSIIYRDIVDMGNLLQNSQIFTIKGKSEFLEDEKIPIQSYRTLGESGGKAICMYWAPHTYQPDICLDEPDLSSKATLIFEKGKFYKVSTDATPNFKSAAFFHFQEWKRTYTSSTDFSPIFFNSNNKKNIKHWALSQYGATPLLSSEVIAEQNENNYSYNSDDETITQSYCIETILERKKPICEWWITWEDVHILHESSNENKLEGKNQVTLAMTLQISAEQITNIQVFDSLLTVAETNIKLWSPQPCILLLHVAGATEEVISQLSQHWKEENDDGGQYILVGAIYSSDSKIVSRKALMNMVSDASQTRWIVTGLELERGLILSKESLFFCLRAAMIYGSIASGDIFIIPQMASLDSIEKDDDDDDDHDESKFQSVSITHLLKNDDGGVEWTYDLSPHDCQICDEQMEERHEQVENQLDQLWWDTTRSELLSQSSNYQMDDHTADILSQVLLGIRRELSNLLLEERLRQFDKSPIIMMDRLGPRPELNTKTENLARHVEELAGWQCHNALQLSQLASYGYRIRTLPGAFAISTPNVRESICPAQDKKGTFTHGSSRCDGCFMIEDSKLLNSIYHAQVKKPAHTQFLWHHQVEHLE